MATGTCRNRKGVARRAIVPAVAALLVFLVLVGRPHAHMTPAASAPAAFGWLRPGAEPPGWAVATTRSGGRLAYPPGWRKIRTDPGTASAAPAGPNGPFAGYLNATPQSGDETVANWSRFRVAHLMDDGERHVRLDAAAAGLRFRTGRGACVIDTYSTVKMRFREIACIVAGARSTTVVVGAAPAAHWGLQAPVLKRAVASFAT
jgi:hypothetical protein